MLCDKKISRAGSGRRRVVCSIRQHQGSKMESSFILYRAAELDDAAPNVLGSLCQGLIGWLMNRLWHDGGPDSKTTCSSRYIRMSCRVKGDLHPQTRLSHKITFFTVLHEDWRRTG